MSRQGHEITGINLMTLAVAMLRDAEEKHLQSLEGVADQSLEGLETFSESLSEPRPDPGYKTDQR